MKDLTRAQLIALATQKTDIAYRNILKMDRYQLIKKLSKVENVLEPEHV